MTIGSSFTLSNTISVPAYIDWSPIYDGGIEIA